jgi:uncharacterized protein YndB with AHSA1/START domain
VKIELSTEIKRPVQDVFAYLTDPDKTPEWNGLVLESKASPAGPVRKGSKIQGVVKVVGRRFEVTADVTEFVPNEKFTTKGNSPFPNEQRFSVEPVAAGTRVTASGQFEPGGFFKLAEPILDRILRRQMRAQFDTLKEILEARVPAEFGS